MLNKKSAGVVVITALFSLPLGLLRAGAEPVEVRAGSSKAGNSPTYTLALTEAPREVRAFGVELNYDPKVLRYTGDFSRGPLVQAFEFFNVNEPEPGQIRLGGFTVAHRISAGTSGDLAALKFERIRDGDARLRVVRLVDDLAVKERAEKLRAQEGPKQ